MGSAEEQAIWQSFGQDAADAIQDIEESLLALEDGVDAEEINRLYRGLHTLKGNSGLLGLRNLESLAHEGEDLIGLVRDGGVSLNSQMVDLMLEALDCLRKMLDEVIARQGPVDNPEAHDLIGRLREENGRHGLRSEAGAEETGDGSVVDDMVIDGVFSGEEEETEEAFEAFEAFEAAEEAVEVEEFDGDEGGTFEDEGLIDPSMDLEFLEIFLELAHEETGKLSEGIATADTDEGKEALLEAAENLSLAAERMGYLHLQDSLDRLRENANEGELLELYKDERRLHRALVAIEETAHTIASEESKPENRRFTDVYQRSCAYQAFADIARSLECLSSSDGELGEESATEVARNMEELQHAARHFELEEESNACMVLSDIFFRISTGELVPTKKQLEEVERFLRALGETIELFQSGVEERTTAETMGALYAAESLLSDHQASEETKGKLFVSERLKNALNREEIETALEAVMRGEELYELRAELESDPEVAEAFGAWIMSGEVRAIQSVTLQVGESLKFDFLLSSAKKAPEVRQKLAEIDPERKHLTLRAVKKEGRRAGDKRQSDQPEPEEAREAAQEVAEREGEPMGEASRPTLSVVEPQESAKKSRPGSANEKKEKEEYLRIDARKVDLIMDLAGEIGLVAGAVIHHPELDDSEKEAFSAVAHNLELLIGELQNEVSGLRLTPVSGVFRRMRRVVRDVSKRTGKQVRLELKGEETEIDKLMVDQLADPLVHMLRNAVDHGIEFPEDRENSGKSSSGTIVLEAAHEGGEVTIKIIDDGKGLDRESILRRANERGLISADKALSDHDIDQLIFHPGLSTRNEVSDFSGRGVGMDVVKTSIEEMRGTIDLHSEPGKGSTFVIRVPLTLAFIEAMVVKEGRWLFIVPIEKVCEVLKVQEEDVSSNSADGQALIRIREDFVPVCWLDNFFGDRQSQPRAVHHPHEELPGRVVVVVQGADGKLALPVDELRGNQRVMLKPLTGILAGVGASAGCGMLPSGDVAVALDCECLCA